MSDRTFYATTYVVADGVTRTWPFSFAGVNPDQESGTTPYIKPADVKVQELYTDAAGNRQTVQRTGVLNSPNQITIDGPAVVAGHEIRIYRETELRFPLVDYRDLQSVSEYDLDLANRQAVFIAQENHDAASANLLYDAQGHYNAGGRRIVDMAPGIDPRDAVNMNQFEHSLRTPSYEGGVQELPPAAQRANKLLGFDALGRPATLLAVSGSATELEQSLRDTVDPSKGAEMIGFADSIPGTADITLADMIRADRVNIMRFIPKEDHAALYAGTSTKDHTVHIQRAIDTLRPGGELLIPPITLRHTGLTILPSRNPKITGMGWRTRLLNIGTQTHCLWVRGDTIQDRTYGLDVSCLTLEGNSQSLDGVHLDRLGWYDAHGLEASVATFDRVQVLNNGGNGIHVGRSSTEGAGNSINILGCYVSGNARTGIVGIGQTNMITVLGCGITRNGVDGIELNQVASTNTVTQNFIADNKRYGVYTFRCEQPIITHNGFNRNMQGALALSGEPTGSVKYTEAGMIFANLFGDNGRSSASHREVSVHATRGTNIIGNYFYGTRQKTMIYLSDYAEGIMMSGNHFKDLTTEVKLEIKPGATNLSYTFDDDLDISLTRNITSNKVRQYLLPAIATMLQTRASGSDPSPRFRVTGDGSMYWGPGTAGEDVSLRRVTPGNLTVSGGLQATTLMVADSIEVPNAAGGYARIFVDKADGKIKVRYDSGVIRTFIVE